MYEFIKGHSEFVYIPQSGWLCEIICENVAYIAKAMVNVERSANKPT